MDHHHMSMSSEVIMVALVGAAFLAGLGTLERSERPDDGPAPARVGEHLRWGVVAALFTASLAHVPMIPAHLEEAAYMGDLFIAFALAAFLLAALLAWRPGRAGFAASAVLCGAAAITYAATRLVAFPQLSDDVGNWAEPLGLVSIVAELAVVTMSVMALRAARRTGGAVVPLRQVL